MVLISVDVVEVYGCDVKDYCNFECSISDILVIIFICDCDYFIIIIILVVWNRWEIIICFILSCYVGCLGG